MKLRDIEKAAGLKIQLEKLNELHSKSIDFELDNPYVPVTVTLYGASPQIESILTAFDAGLVRNIIKNSIEQKITQVQQDLAELGVV